MPPNIVENVTGLITFTVNFLSSLQAINATVPPVPAAGKTDNVTASNVCNPLNKQQPNNLRQMMARHPQTSGGRAPSDK